MTENGVADQLARELAVELEDGFDEEAVARCWRKLRSLGLTEIEAAEVLAREFGLDEFEREVAEKRARERALEDFKEELARERALEELEEALDEEEVRHYCAGCWRELASCPYPENASRLLDQGVYASMELIQEELAKLRARQAAHARLACRGCGREVDSGCRATVPLGRAAMEAQEPPVRAKPRKPIWSPRLEESIGNSLLERHRRRPVSALVQRTLARQTAAVARRSMRGARPRRGRRGGRRPAARGPPGRRGRDPKCDLADPAAPAGRLTAASFFRAEQAAEVKLSLRTDGTATAAATACAALTPAWASAGGRIDDLAARLELRQPWVLGSARG